MKRTRRGKRIKLDQTAISKALDIQYAQREKDKEMTPLQIREEELKSQLLTVQEQLKGRPGTSTWCSAILKKWDIDIKLASVQRQIEAENEMENRRLR